jgi:hypothetical protein
VKAEKKKNVAAMKEVPRMKRSLEEFVFRVKLLLNAHGLSDAFWYARREGEKDCVM